MSCPSELGATKQEEDSNRDVLANHIKRFQAGEE